jgi:ketosteroid isomerase-like protein
LIRKAVSDALAAYNRRDWDAMLLNIAPDVELVPPPQFVTVGFEATYHGHDGYVAYHEQWIEHWGEFRVIPTRMYDLGERTVILGDMGGRELRSDVPLDTEFGTVDSYEDARAVRQEVYLSHSEALRAAGLER